MKVLLHGVKDTAFHRCSDTPANDRDFLNANPARNPAFDVGLVNPEGPCQLYVGAGCIRRDEGASQKVVVDPKSGLP